MTRWTTVLTPLLLLASVALAPAATVTLTWDAPSLAPGQSAPEGYALYRLDPTTGAYAELVRLPLATLTYADQLADPGHYSYVVRAFRGPRLSDASNEATSTVPVPAPGTLTAALVAEEPPAPPAPPVAPPGPYPLRSTTGMTATADSQEPGMGAELALDGLPGTFWHTQFTGATSPMPHSLTVDLGAVLWVDGMRYLPRPAGSSNGNMTQYRLDVSSDLVVWNVVAGGPLAGNATEKIIRFSAVQARYVRLVALASLEGRPYANAAEVGVYAVEATP
jgi:hypothetical protein